MARETIEMENLIDAEVTVRYNYSGFVPASTLYIDDQGKEFIIYIVPPLDGRWFVERNVNFHGSFRTEAANEFDEHNHKAEAFSFIRKHVAPPAIAKNQDGINTQRSDKTTNSDHTLAKKDSSSDSKCDPFDQISEEKGKEKGKAVMSINEQDLSHCSKRSKRTSKRKVSFLSPSGNTSHGSGYSKRKILNINCKSLVLKTNEEGSVVKKDHQNKSYQKKYYRTKRVKASNNENQVHPLPPKSKDDNSTNLMVDLGPLSTLETLQYSNGNLMQTDKPTKTSKEEAPEATALKTNSNTERISMEEDVKEEEDIGKEIEGNSSDSKEVKEKAFKAKLVDWLKENELKLSPKHPLDYTSTSLNSVNVSMENVDILGIEPLGDHSFK